MQKDDLLDSKQKIDQELSKINELVNARLINNAYIKYNDLIKKIENTETESAQKAALYASFAFFLFRVSEYDQFYKMLIKAQEYGYSTDEIEMVLWEALVEPNLNEFKTNYEANIELLRSNNYLHFVVPEDFQMLPYWLLPTGKINEYYLYDKAQKRIEEKVSLYTYKKLDFPPDSDSFTDYLLLDNWDLGRILAATDAVKPTNKKTYIVLDDAPKFLSCLQGAPMNKGTISNVLFFASHQSLQEYFGNSSTFLPRNVINHAGKMEDAQNILNEIHKERIHKENRKGDSVLLSICIPSFNRGNRAYDNIVRLLQSSYDEEIEIILSNNGTQNETKSYYDKLQKIEDARFTYFAFEENQGFAINLCKVCELARGKFILLLSDEDIIDLLVLNKIMDILYRSQDSLSMLRTSTNYQSKVSNLVARAGKEAMLAFMLTSNYVSGVIVNNRLLKERKGIEYVKEHLDNSVCLWYPHMFWELLLCQYGNVQGTDLILINEGKAEKTDVDEVQLGKSEVSIPYYATIEGRLEQHEGFASIFKDLEIGKSNPALLREMYVKLCIKSLFLVKLSINVFYRRIDPDALKLLDRAFDACTKEEFYKANINGNRKNFQSDLAVITQSYKHFKSQN